MPLDPEPKTSAEWKEAYLTLEAKHGSSKVQIDRLTFEKQQLQDAVNFAKLKESAAETAKTSAKAALDARQKDLADAMTKVLELEKRLPTGAYAVRNTDPASTPAVSLAVSTLCDAADDTVRLNLAELKKRIVVLVDELPNPEDTARYRHFVADSRRREQELRNFVQRLSGSAGLPLLTMPEYQALRTEFVPRLEAESIAVAATIISALPALISTAAGLFRSDVAENVAAVDLTDSALVAAVTGTLFALAEPTKVYHRWDHYVAAHAATISTWESLDAAALCARRKFALPRFLAELEAKGEAAAPFVAELRKFADDYAAAASRIDPAVDGGVALTGIVKEESACKARAATEVRLLAVRRAKSSHSTVSRKTFLGQSHRALAMMAIEYRLAEANGAILKSGLLQVTRIRELNDPEDLKPFEFS